MEREQLNAQIIAQRERKAAAERAEEERLQREKTAREEIAAADAELQRLLKLSARVDFNEALKENVHALEVNAAAVAKFQDALLTVEAALIATLADASAVNDTFNEQQGIHGMAMAKVRGLVEHAEMLPDAVPNLGGMDNRQNERMRAALTLNNQFDNEIDPALPLWAVLQLYIAQSQDANQKRRRAAIAAAFTGAMWDVPADLTEGNLRETVKRNLQRQRASGVRGI